MSVHQKIQSYHETNLPESLSTRQKILEKIRSALLRGRCRSRHSDPQIQRDIKDQLQLLGSTGWIFLLLGMEKEFLRMILPEGLLDHFDITGIDKGTESDGKPFLRVHLTEKNDLRDVGGPKQYESKGFHKSKTLTDFPIRGQFVYLEIKRRRWRHKKDPRRIVSNDYSLLAKGTKLTRELSDFLKDTRGVAQ